MDRWIQKEREREKEERHSSAYPIVKRDDVTNSVPLDFGSEERKICTFRV